MSLALVDGDILRYRLGFAVQHTEFTTSDGNVHRGKRELNAYLKEHPDQEVTIEELVVEPVSHALKLVKNELDHIKHKCKCKKPIIYLSGKDNFRLDLYPEYKANRKDMVKPAHYHAIGDYLIEQHDAIVIDGMEADDALAIRQSSQPDTIICSIDKDLLQVPGRHFDFVKDIFYDVTEAQGLLSLYTQILTGDATDNIPGIPGVGPKKALKALSGATSERELYDYALACYEENGLGVEDLKLNAQLVYLLRYPEDEWEVPTHAEEDIQT